MNRPWIYVCILSTLHCQNPVNSDIPIQWHLGIFTPPTSVLRSWGILINQIQWQLSDENINHWMGNHWIRISILSRDISSKLKGIELYSVGTHNWKLLMTSLRTCEWMLLVTHRSSCCKLCAAADVNINLMTQLTHSISWLTYILTNHWMSILTNRSSDMSLKHWRHCLIY